MGQRADTCIAESDMYRGGGRGALRGTDIKAAICAPFTDLETLVKEFAGTGIGVGAQNVHFEEEGAFTLDDVICGIRDKMIRRHPHVFGDAHVSGSQEVLVNWEQIKAKEKEGKKDTGDYLPQAFEEAKEMIERAKKRKGY